MSGTRIVAISMCLAIWTGTGAAQQQGKVIATRGEGFSLQEAGKSGLVAGAYLCEVSPAQLALADGLLYTEAVQKRFLSSKAVQALPPGLQARLQEDPRSCVLAAQAGAPASGALVLVVQGFQDGKQARQLAEALAEAYIQSVRHWQSQKLLPRIQVLEKRREELREKLKTLSQERAKLTAAGPMAAMPEGRSLVSFELEALARMTVEAELSRAAAAAELEAFKQAVKESTAADFPPVRRATEADPLLRELNARLTDAELARAHGAPAGEEPPPAAEIDSLKKDIQALRKELVTAQIEAFRRSKEQDFGAATSRLAELKQRMDRTRAEARDVETALGTIRAVSAEESQVAESLRKVEGQLLDLQVQAEAPEAVPMLLGVVVESRSGKN